MTVPYTELETRAATWPEQARALTIESPESYQRAAQLLTGIKALLREIEETCEPVVKAAYAAHRAATQQRKKLEAPLLTAEGTIKKMMGTYLRAEQQRRQEEHERLLEASLAKERENRTQQVAALKAADDPAAAVLEAAPLPIVFDDPSAPPTADGISVRTILRAEVTDLALLARSVVEGRAPLKVLLPNMAVLNTFARSLGKTMNWPGVQVVEDVSISAKAALE
jgi:hypothetical protein